MKKIFFGSFALLSLLAVGCSKSDSGNTPSGGNNGSLNATEEKLIGTWFLKKERYTVRPIGTANASTDSIYNNFPNTPYVKFTSTKHPDAGGGAFNAAAKVMTDKTNISTGSSITLTGPSRGATAAEAPWYFDETSKSLIARFSNFPYVNVDASKLTIASYLGSSGIAITDTLWFEKQ